jgi:CheY-like chemotaxis protein
MGLVRVLIVDDYEPFRRLIRSMLESPSFEIVGEASDGLEAIQKATLVQPDLILLDIGLPNLTGLEVAKRVLALGPQARILFVSQDGSPDLVREALRVGGRGYVQKSRIGRDLLSAVRAVLGGTQFVSGGAGGYELGEGTGGAKSCRHEVLFYSDETVFLDSFTRFVAGALEAGDVAIVLATGSHRDGLAQRLKAHGLDIDAALRQGTYIPLDVSTTLSTFMVNDMPDPDLFFEVVGDLIREAAKTRKTEHSRVAACGECAPLLWSEGKADAAIRVEQLWGQIATTYEVDTLCGYALSSFHGEQHQDVFESLCSEHSAVYSR